MQGKGWGKLKERWSGPVQKQELPIHVHPRAEGVQKLKTRQMVTRRTLDVSCLIWLFKLFNWVLFCSTLSKNYRDYF